MNCGNKSESCGGCCTRGFSWILLLLLGALGYWASCGLTDVQKATRAGILLMGIEEEPSSLDPQLLIPIENQCVMAALFEGLVLAQADTPEPAPGMAQSWEVDTTGSIYTFHLRPEAAWSDGHPLTAQDFVFAFKRSLSGRHADQFDVLKGAQNYRLGSTSDFGSVGVKALDAHTLQLTLSQAVPYFLSLLTHWAWSPLPQHILDACRTPEHGDALWTQNLVCNGPFMPKKLVHNGYLDVTRNPHYWDALALNGIHFAFMKAETQQRAFEGQQLHIATCVPSHAQEKYKASGDLKMDPFLGTYYYIFNTRHEALKDVRVRRALCMAIDRKALIQRVTGGMEHPAYSLVPPQIPHYQAPENSLTEDAKQAQNLLAQAGYPSGKNFPKLEILFNTADSHKLMAEAIQYSWKHVLGIEVELVNQEFKVYLDSRAKGQFMVARASWIGDYVDSYTFLSIWHSRASNNYAGWTDARYDALLEASNQQSDPQKRRALMRDAEGLLLEGAPLMPIYFYNTRQLVRPEVSGRMQHLLKWYNYKFMDVRKGLRGEKG